MNLKVFINWTLISQILINNPLFYLISLTPSIISSSDAGAGIGYTYMTIRGSDANRINVTINGIPLNDSESQGVWWVNMPDFSSSLENIQIQRGVGTSTNGAAAFGGSINLTTNKISHYINHNLRQHWTKNKKQPAINHEICLKWSWKNWRSKR